MPRAKEPDFPAAPDVVVPGYEVERIIGRGGCGTVLAARRRSSGLQVAIKLAHPGDVSARALMATEARALAAVGPPAAPALYETGTLADGRTFMAMELLLLPTLERRLSAIDGPMAPAEFARWAAAVLDAIAAVHARGYVHLDIKPGNLFLCDAPLHARLADFGLARPLPGKSGVAEPVSGTVAGTPEYMSPEQCAGTADLDVRTDIYAVGVLLFRLLTGRAPFVGLEGEVRAAHLNLRPPRPSELAKVPRSVEALVLRCLAKEPDRRFPAVSELARALNEALAPADPSLPVPSSPRRKLGPVPVAERRTVGLVFFLTPADPPTARDALGTLGGHLGYLAHGRAVAVFEGNVAGNPVRRAIRAAEGLLERGLATHAKVDLAPVAVMKRKSGGEPRYFSAAFANKDRHLRGGDHDKLLITAAAAEVLSDLSLAPVSGRAGMVRLRGQSADEPVSCNGAQQAGRDMVGREALASELLAGAAAALSKRRPTIVTVIGEAGYGKTTLAAALVKTLGAALPEAERISLTAREPLAGDTDATLRRLLRKLLDWPSAPPADGGLACAIAALGPLLGRELWPAVALAFGLLRPDAPALRDQGAAPGVLRSMIVRAAGEALRQRAARRPVCLILDDAQFADDATLDAIEFAALAEAAAPLWVCVCGQPSFEAARRSFGERAAERREHLLAPLDQGSAAKLCRRLLEPAENVPAEAIARLVERTRGIPLLLVELVRGLKREGLVRRRAHGESSYLATDEIDKLPDLPLVEWAAEREISALGPELKAHARLAALLGPDFRAEEVEGVLAVLVREGMADDLPLDAGVGTSGMVGADLLVVDPQGGLRFRHSVVRDVVARSIPEPERARIHRAAYRFYGSAAALPEGLRLARLALHAAATGLDAEAAAIYLDLAERARARHAYLDAERTYSRAIELLPHHDAALRLAAHRGRAGMRYRVGRYEDSLSDFVEARALARALGDAPAEVELLLDEATALDWANDYTRSEAHVAEAADVAARGSVASRLVEARLLLGRGRALFRGGRWGEACQALEGAAATADDLGDPGYETLVVSLAMLEVVLPNLGRIDDAEQVSERVVSLVKQRGDQLHLATALNNRRNVLIARGDVARAVADQQDFMQIGRDLGLVVAEYFGEYNLGELLYQAGDLAAAEPHVRRAVTIEARHAEVASGPVAVLLAARLLAYQGRCAEARARLSEIDAALCRGGAAGALAPPEEVLYAMVDLSTRDATEAEWDAVTARASRESIEQEPIEVMELRGVAALRSGRRADARRHLEAALALAARIPNIMVPRLERALAATRVTGRPSSRRGPALDLGRSLA